MAAYTPNTNNINNNNNDTHVHLEGSILRDEYDSINRKIGHLQEAHLVALRTLHPLPGDPVPIKVRNKHSHYETVRLPALVAEQWDHYEVATIWLNNQNDVDAYCGYLNEAIKALGAQKTDIVKGLVNRTTH